MLLHLCPLDSHWAELSLRNADIAGLRQWEHSIVRGILEQRSPNSDGVLHHIDYLTCLLQRENLTIAWTRCTSMQTSPWIHIIISTRNVLSWTIRSSLEISGCHEHHIHPNDSSDNIDNNAPSIVLFLSVSSENGYQRTWNCNIHHKLYFAPNHNDLLLLQYINL